jgi:hypothetical protein
MPLILATMGRGGSLKGYLIWLFKGCVTSWPEPSNACPCQTSVICDYCFSKERYGTLDVCVGSQRLIQTKVSELFSTAEERLPPNYIKPFSVSYFHLFLWFRINFFLSFFQLFQLCCLDIFFPSILFYFRCTFLLFFLGHVLLLMFLSNACSYSPSRAWFHMSNLKYDPLRTRAWETIEDSTWVRRRVRCHLGWTMSFLTQVFTRWALWISGGKGTILGEAEVIMLGCVLGVEGG